MPLCSRCKIDKPLSDFHLRRSKDRQGKCEAYCKLCMRAYRTIRINLRKMKLIKLKGGVCEQCKESFHPAAFHFHHRDPSRKEFNWSRELREKPWKEILIEIEKCDLVCAICHILIHIKSEYWPEYYELEQPPGLPESNELQLLISKHPLTDVAIHFGVGPRTVKKWCDRFNIQRPTRSHLYLTKTEPKQPDHHCLECQQPISRQATYCRVCAAKHLQKKRPSYDELSQLVWQIPTSKIAKQFDVSETLVQKWCKQMQISKPGAGYWTNRHQ